MIFPWYRQQAPGMQAALLNYWMARPALVIRTDTVCQRQYLAANRRCLFIFPYGAEKKAKLNLYLKGMVIDLTWSLCFPGDFGRTVPAVCVPIWSSYWLIWSWPTCFPGGMYRGRVHLSQRYQWKYGETGWRQAAQYQQVELWICASSGPWLFSTWPGFLNIN